MEKPHIIQYKNEQILNTFLATLDRFFTNYRIPYAIFGDIASSIYTGYYTHKVQNLNISIPYRYIPTISEFLFEQGFTRFENTLSSKAHFARFIQTTSREYMPRVLLYPERFTLLDRTDNSLPYLDEYHFPTTEDATRKKTIRCLANTQQQTNLTVTNPTNLFLSFLWPSFTITNMYSLFTLLCSLEIRSLHFEWLVQQIRLSNIREQYRESIYCCHSYIRAIQKRKSPTIHSYLTMNTFLTSLLEYTKSVVRAY